VIQQNLASGGEVTRSAAVVASWARYAEGTDESGEPIDVVDGLRDERMASARRRAEDPLAFVRNEQLFGDMARQSAFASAYLLALESFQKNGALRTVEQINENLRLGL
jgi:mannitol 2-dehydrogenase